MIGKLPPRGSVPKSVEAQIQAKVFAKSEVHYHSRLFRIPLGSASNDDRTEYQDLMLLLLDVDRDDICMPANFSPLRSIDSREGVAYVYVEWVVRIDNEDALRKQASVAQGNYTF